MPKGGPLLPTKSDSLLTIPEPFSLPGDQRSVERATYDAEMREKAIQQKVKKSDA